MNDAIMAILMFVPYALVDQWEFRCQRVGRGILLRAKGTAAGHPHLFASIMPASCHAALWISRALWFLCFAFFWRAWGIFGVGAFVAYSFVLGAWVDEYSPWPRYEPILSAVKGRIFSGAAGIHDIRHWHDLMATIFRIEDEMGKGAHFEEATTDVWLGLRGSDSPPNEPDR